FFVGARYRDEFPEAKAPERASPPVSGGALFTAVVIAAIAVSAAPAYAMWRENRPLTVDASAFATPPQYAGWETGPAGNAWTPNFAGQDAKQAYSMDRSSFTTPPVDVFVYYYGRARGGRSLIESTNKMWNEERWNAVSSAGLTAHIGKTSVPFRELQLASP